MAQRSVVATCTPRPVAQRAWIVAAILTSILSQTPTGAACASQWAIDPTEPGPKVPARGRSLFDELTEDGVPFPFEALLAQIDRRLGCSSHTCIDAVLIPLGRSLQRLSAAPDFFGSPRIVAAVTGEGDGRVLARHRLYLGYQPRAAVIEVISYNEQAGRFEFQIVHAYRAGGRPRTTQAERTVCLACHQNHAPIFSRPLWSETSANPLVATALGAAAGAAVARDGRWFGVDLRRGVDAPNAIDEATDAANLYAVTQRLWRDACDARCRRTAVKAAVAYRLSGGRVFEPLPHFASAFEAAFPDGLAIPNPDLPNRDPMPATVTGAMRAHVPGGFEALRPRAPLEVWRASDPYLDRRFVIGLAAMVASRDVASLRRDPAAAYARLRTHGCEDATVSRAMLRQALGLAHDPGLATRAQIPPPAPNRAADAVPRNAAPPVPALPTREAEFVAPCGACHATEEPTPPNFLAGDAARVKANLRQCAPRIFVRLALWQRDPAAWAKVPMPPPRAAAAGRPALQTSADPVVVTLRRTVADWIEDEGRGTASLDRLLEQGYENLRPCLTVRH
ncbi:MAG TPA: hypothetical protein VF055_12455 [Steroidobacteraceae bacterium]